MPWKIKLFLINKRTFLKINILLIKTRLKKVFSNSTENNSEKYNLAILCVKNTKYATMTIANVNSLHYFNSNHKFTIYCDQICADFLNKKINNFDYKENVSIKLLEPEERWQKYKIKMQIMASKEGEIMIDADSLWTKSPIIKKDKIYFLALSNKISESKRESLLIKNIFNKEDWLNFGHFVSAFLYIPKELMTEKVTSDLWEIEKNISESTMDFLSPEESSELKRLSEELAINLALQSNYGYERINTLKETGDPNNLDTVKSIYYGSFNKINK